MKYELTRFILILTFSHFLIFSFSQKVGVGTTSPAGKLHVKGSANISQLIIDAHSTQGNTNPLIKLRNSSGTDLMWIHSDNIYNTFIGLNAGRVNNAGGGGTYNTFIGRDAGYSNTTGYWNTAIGANALYSNTTGLSNSANGMYALYFNTTGNSNTANGFYALYSNISGNNNAANGWKALYSNTTGNFNTANGISALYSNTTGVQNTATGGYALYANTTGTKNTASGYSALNSNTTGEENTAIGNGALYSSTGNYNTATGSLALYSNMGSFNTATGRRALYNNTTGTLNTANGVNALTSNTSGDENTAMGTNALYSNTTGEYNTAHGYEALFSNTSGSFNTAIGKDALSNNTTSNLNTAIGVAAGTLSSADNNTFLGSYADVNNGAHFGSTAIGSNMTITASNQVRIGAGATSIGGPQNWTNTSDGRIKNNILEDVQGLDFIKLLRPVTYTKSFQQEMDIIGVTTKRKLPAGNPYETIRYSGFIAQEVELAAQSIGYNFSGVDAPKNDKDLYGLRYAEFVVPLVKAVQELSGMNQELSTRNKEQDLIIETLTQRIEKIESIIVGRE